MKAILINAKDRTIAEVEYGGDYRDIYKLLSGDEPGKVDLFTAVELNAEKDTMFLDDEGLLKPQADFFRWRDYGDGTHPFAGNALILGTDDDGDSVEPKITLDEVKAKVTFTSAKDEGFDPSVAPMDQTRRFDPVFISGDAAKALLGF